MTAADEARSLFASLTDAAPASRWSAPGRVNLIGEHTDYNDGFVLPFAIDRRTHVALGRRDDGVIRVASTFARHPVALDLADLPRAFPAGRDRIPTWARYPLGVAWALLRTGGAAVFCGVDLAFASEVPVGAGLSSSAAIESAAAVALDDAWGLGLDRRALAQAGRTAENEAVGTPTGIMDQTASLLGRKDAAVLLDCRSLETTFVGLGLAAAHLDLLVIDTRAAHAHATGGYRERREACERGAALAGVPALRDLTPGDLPRASRLMDDATFRRVRHVVTEDRRVLDTVDLLRADGPRAIGRLLVESHASMRDDFEISTPELDTAVEASLAAGALGARMTGGGFGGSAIALVDRALARTVTDAVIAAFAARGLGRPRVFAATPSDGARRDG